MKKVLIFILIIGGIIMAVNGFDDSKNEKEVYTKEEVDELIAKYVLKGDFAVIEGIYSAISVPTEDGHSLVFSPSDITYPEGFNKDNCVVISIMHSIESIDGDTTIPFNGRWFCGSDNYCDEFRVYLSSTIRIQRITDLFDTTIYGKYKIILMKLPEVDSSVDVSDYQQGDVNMDGQITQEDSNLVLSYDTGNISLTDKQLKLAEMNGDGIVDTLDALAIQKIVEG